MADNVAITAGAGTTVATDQIPGTLEHIQIVKIADGTADSATRIPGGASGLKVDLTSTGANATAIKVDGSAVTQPVSGTLTAITNVVHVDDNAGSLTVDGTVGVSGTVTVDSELTLGDMDTGAGTDNRAVVGLVGAKSGGGVLIPGDATKGLAVDLTATGANTIALKTDGSAVTQPVSAASLPLPTGASTAAKQPALGTAGTASADVLTIQGIASMTAVKVDGSAVTQPVSFGTGTTSIQVQSSGLTTSVTAYTAGDQLGAEMTFANAAASAGTFTIVSATLTDAAKVTGSCDLFLFDQSGVTHAGDNAANAWSDADILKCIGVISFPPPVLSANNSIATVPVVGLAGKLSAGTSLYGVLVTRIGHTFFGAATDLAVRLLIQKD